MSADSTPQDDLSVTPTYEEYLNNMATMRARYEKLRAACQNAKAHCRGILETPETSLATPFHAANRVRDILSDLDQVWDTSPAYQGGPLQNA
jgi:CHASE3 domain sensor protein